MRCLMTQYFYLMKQEQTCCVFKLTVIGGEESGVVQVILNIRGLSVQNGDGVDASIVWVNSQPISWV